MWALTLSITTSESERFIHKQRQWEILLFHKFEMEINHKLRHKEEDIIQTTSHDVGKRSWSTITIPERYIIPDSEENAIECIYALF